MRRFTLMGFLCLALGARAAEAPKFTGKPTAGRAGGKVVIEFAVDSETDVAVFIENGAGEVVRHLVAGVLGKNPPAPLKPGLSQSIEWDGKADYGKPAGSGPFRVRVALGVGARFDQIIARDPQNFGLIQCMATAPDGTLYVCHRFGIGVSNFKGDRVVAVGRDGKYRRTVLPWPVTLPKGKLGGYKTLELEGRPAPLVRDIQRRRFTADVGMIKGGMAITADGVILRPMGTARKSPFPRLAAIGVDGSAPWNSEGGPDLFGQGSALFFVTPFVAVSSDGKWAYFTGVGSKKAMKGFPAVYRVPIPRRTGAKPFFGDPARAGKSKGLLAGTPAGVAVDGRGNLLVADTAGDRVVVVSEADGKQVGEFAVSKPDFVAVNPKTGEVYVTSLAGRKAGHLIKFSGWKNARAVARLTLPGRHSMVLDASAQPAVVWMSGCHASGGTGKLLRIESTNGKLESRNVASRKFGNLGFGALEVSRFRKDKELLVRCGKGNHLRYSEKTGKWEKPRFEARGIFRLYTLMPGPRDSVVGAVYPMNLARFTHDGKPLPWTVSKESYPKDVMRKGKPVSGLPHTVYCPTGMQHLGHTTAVRGDDTVWALQARGPGGRGFKSLRGFDWDGRHVSKDPLIWKVSDTAMVRFDPQGNIYVAEQVKPLGQPYPPEFKSVVGPVEPGKKYAKFFRNEKGAAMCMYGSIVKFSPKGGTIGYPRHKRNRNPYDGEPKLDPSLKTVDAAYYVGEKSQRLNRVKVTGAEWIRMGVSHVALHYCNCEAVRFDVDEFGRVWYPDLGRFRVTVLDTGGNEMFHFGGYGNTESAGPGSAIPRPEIAFAWLVGVGVTDKYVYTADSLNRRLLRSKIVYAAEETCAVR